MSDTTTVSPLRQRMIEDMAARKLNPNTQRSHIQSCKRFAAWLKRSLDGTRWVASRSNFLVHVNLLARLFRGKMLAMLTEAYDASQLTFFNTLAGLADNRTFKRFIAPLRRIKWVVYCKAPFAGPEQVL